MSTSGNTTIRLGDSAERLDALVEHYHSEQTGPGAGPTPSDVIRHAIDQLYAEVLAPAKTRARKR